MKFKEEWIISNGNGYYSSSTISSTNTRSYHGLFVSLDPDFSRTVLLSKIWEEVELNEKKYYLDTNLFGDVLHPNGYANLKRFELFPIPTFSYQLGSTIVNKEYFWHPSRNNLFVKYSVSGPPPDRVKLVPLTGLRKAGSMNTFGTYASKYDGYLKIEREGKTVYLWGGDAFEQREEWYRNFNYVIEKERGYGYTEDLYSPGYFTFSGMEEFVVQISDGADSVDAKVARRGFLDRITPAFNRNEFPDRFRQVSDMFVAGKDILAGFPWFGAWSRDTFVSIPGLLLVKGKFELAKNILENYAERYPDGKFSNYVGGTLTPADSPLWYIYAVKKYLDYTSDLLFLKRILNYCTSIVLNYINGYNGIEIIEGLVSSPAGTTWMDAFCDGEFQTPREGMAVEVNALWHNALQSLREFYHRLNSEFPTEMEELISASRKRFQEVFVSNKTVKDVAEPDDLSVRPNMLLAFSLPFPVIKNFKLFRKSIVDLVTPYGLRTLSPSDPRFSSLYSGDQCSRDRAYHNGTIWPWLVGPYITASVRSGIDKGQLKDFFAPLLTMNYVPEIFDGFLPGEPRGCIVQAWSYGEILRAFVEDLR